MANPIYHSQYTAAQIEALISHGTPIIQNGTWWTWDISASAYADTGVSAEGAEAWRGIANEYDEDAIYSAGNYCIYNGVLYICTAPTYTTGDFDPTRWDQTTVATHLENQQRVIDGSREVVNRTVADIATVENSTASKAYEVGEYLMKGIPSLTGVYIPYLCRVTSPISAGGTITIGTNCVVVAAMDEVRNLVINSYPHSTASGSAVRIEDGADGIPVRSMTAQIVPYQSGWGEPALTNQRPFVPRTSQVIYACGANLPLGAPIALKNATYTLDGVNLRVTDASAETYAGCQCIPGWIFYRPVAGRKITISCDIVIHSGTAGFGCRYPSSRPTSPSVMVPGASIIPITTDGHYNITFTTLDEPVALVFFSSYSEAAAGDVEYKNLMVEIGESESDVAPVAANTSKTISFGEAGDVYGGELDVVSGSLSVTYRRIVLNGQQAIAEVAQRTNTTRFALYLGTGDATRTKNQASLYSIDLAYAMCDKLPSVAYVLNNDLVGLYVAYFNPESYAQYGSAIYISVPRIELSGSTQEEMIAEVKAWLADNPLEIVYRLDVPATYQLAQTQINTLLGTNSFMALTGDIAVDYRADPTLFVNEKINAVMAAISEL